MPSFSCLRGIETRGEDNDDHRSSSSIFHRNDNKEKKNTKMTAICRQRHNAREKKKP